MVFTNEEKIEIVRKEQLLPYEELESQIEALEEQICEDIEWGVRPSIAIRERCREAMEKAQQ